MYEELEKTTFESVNKSKELKEECERLQHNLNLREEQLTKQSGQISEYMKKTEHLENEITLNQNEEKFEKMIAAKDKEIAEVFFDESDCLVEREIGFKLF